MQVYKKILVTMDCSEVDDVILEHVSALAQQNSATVYLLHVVHSHTLDQDRTLRQRAEAALSVRREQLGKDGIETVIVLRAGEPEEEILKEVEENDYDLVAMATHGHGFVCDALFGSVSRALKHKLTVPLLLVGQGVKK